VNRGGILTAPLAPGSLRAGFAWTAAGNAVYAAGQWAILSLIAKLGDVRMLGEYAYALSLILPVAMLAHLNLRSVLATDAALAHPFGDYLAVRRATNAGLVAIAVLLALLLTPTPGLAAVLLLLAAALAAENTSDLYYGALQRRNRLDQVARSLMLRSALSVAAVAVALALRHDLVVAMLALALARAAVAFFYDWPRASSGEDLDRSPAASTRWILFRSALPLGLVLLLVSLTSNVPRYAVEHYLGARELGAYAAAASFITVGTTVVNALGQSATSSMARAFSLGDWRVFRRLSTRVVSAALLLGIAGVCTAWAIGGPVLALLYRPEYSVYRPTLIQLMGAAAVLYVAVALGYVVTSARSFMPQLPLLTCVATTSAAVSWVLVPRYGLGGAAAALALAAGVQCVGQGWILRRALGAAR
jgi:O-antigen/teichoic acid export membrane protein